MNVYLFSLTSIDPTERSPWEIDRACLCEPDLVETVRPNRRYLSAAFVTAVAARWPIRNPLRSVIRNGDAGRKPIGQRI